MEMQLVTDGWQPNSLFLPNDLGGFGVWKPRHATIKHEMEASCENRKERMKMN